MLRGIQRIAKNNDVSATDFTIGKEFAPCPTVAVMDFVHQQIVADQQGLFHGFRGNLESLGQEGDVKERHYHRHAQPLRKRQAAGYRGGLLLARRERGGRSGGSAQRIQAGLKTLGALKNLRVDAAGSFGFSGSWREGVAHRRLPVIRAGACTCQSAVLARPPLNSSPRPSRRKSPKLISFATRTKCRVLTKCARNLESSPSPRSGKVANRASLVTIPRMESPKNSSSSLSGRAPLMAGCTRWPPSCANELWVRACCSSSGLRKRWPSIASNSAIALLSIC